MDLASLEPTQDGAEMQVVHPKTSAPIEGVVITLLGNDSKRAVQVQQRQQNRRMSQGVHRMKLTAEGLESDALELLAALTLDWRGVQLEGNALPYSPENARMLYQRLRWLREQVDAFVGDRANFLPNSATS